MYLYFVKAINVSLVIEQSVTLFFIYSFLKSMIFKSQHFGLHFNNIF